MLTTVLSNALSKKNEVKSGLVTKRSRPRRVKVYLLEGENWLDKGTGYCVGEIDQVSKQPYFIVRGEDNLDEVVLKSFLEGSIQYQRQQETLIVWTDREGMDLALSFEEVEGCVDLCNFIIKMQREDFSPGISLYYVISNNVVEGDTSYINEGQEITELIVGPVSYPESPSIDNLEKCLLSIKMGADAHFTKKCILDYIMQSRYTEKLISIFKICRERRLLKHLFLLSDLVRVLFLYNESALIDDFFSSEEKVVGVIEILEYNREYPKMKACYLEFLQEHSNFDVFLGICGVENEAELWMFKKDFYLNYFKDIILAKATSEPVKNTISSLIYFSQINIIESLASSNEKGSLLVRLFRAFNSPEEDPEVKRNRVKLIQKYILTAKAVQLQGNFFSTLVNNGLLNVIHFALQDQERIIRKIGIQFIFFAIEQDISLIDFVDKEDAIDNTDPPTDVPKLLEEELNRDTKKSRINQMLSDDMSLLKLLSELLLKDEDFDQKMQAFEALRILLDSNVGAYSAKDRQDEVRLGFNSKPADESYDDMLSGSLNEKQKVDTNNYFKAFYSLVAPQLFHPLQELAAIDDKFGISLNTEMTSLTYKYLCELLVACLRQHEPGIAKAFFLENDIILGVAKLLVSNSNMILKLCALRCLKAICLLSDTDYANCMVESQIFKYFVSFFGRVVQDRNLANSACLDFINTIIKRCDSDVPTTRNLFKKFAGLVREYSSPHFLAQVCASPVCLALFQMLERDNDSDASPVQENPNGEGESRLSISHVKDPSSGNNSPLEGSRSSSYDVATINRIANNKAGTSNYLFGGVEEELERHSEETEKL